MLPPRKAFVADGSSTNWGVWQKYFSHYTPILDFVHALMYVYAAAMAGRHSANEGWSHYRDWSQWLWSGQVKQNTRCAQATPTGTRPSREKRNEHSSRPSGQFSQVPDEPAFADEIRRISPTGLTITSSPIESTIKQINRRIKGTEKFWDGGADPMLHLVADRLSQTNVSKILGPSPRSPDSVCQLSAGWLKKQHATCALSG